jgi:hypothetical protein
VKKDGDGSGRATGVEGTNDRVVSASTEIEWDAVTRIAVVSYAPETTLTIADATFLVGALTRWIGSAKEPFGIFARAGGVRATDAAYRAATSEFFRQHRSSARIALVGMSTILGLVVDMFRVGTGVQLKAFTDEAAARAWLAAKSAHP